MIEYKITRQAVDMEWALVQGAHAREMDLYSPAGDDWTLHSFEHSPTEVVAVWERQRRAHAMSDVYSHSESQDSTAAQPPVKTIADMPEPR